MVNSLKLVTIGQAKIKIPFAQIRWQDLQAYFCSPQKKKLESCQIPTIIYDLFLENIGRSKASTDDAEEEEKEGVF